MMKKALLFLATMHVAMPLINAEPAKRNKKLEERRDKRLAHWSVRKI